jgi:hypothetical protein
VTETGVVVKNVSIPKAHNDKKIPSVLVWRRLFLSTCHLRRIQVRRSVDGKSKPK